MSEAKIEGIDHLRQAWRAAGLAPLWESPTAHKPPPGPDPARHWSWSAIRPLLGEAMKITSPDAVERRVLSLAGARPRHPEDEATARTISAAIQMLLPGEKARPHRHTMNAIRFVIEGEGASTLVDGKDCPMKEGDLVLTPGWTWHEHVHRGDKPILWLDILDVPLHLWLGVAAFQPGPINDNPVTHADAAFAFPNLLPDVELDQRTFSPIFRYPWADAAAAVAVAPHGKDGARRVRYVNPVTGGPAMDILDCVVTQIDKGQKTAAFRTNANAVCHVVEGEGETTVGDQTFKWSARDVFSLPQNNWITHRGGSKTSRLFIASDRDAMRRLGFLKEEYRSGAG